MSRKIAYYDKDQKKVVWVDPEALRPKESEAPNVWGCVEFKAVGLPGQPMITSREQYRRLLKQHGYEVVGNDRSCMPPDMRK